MLPAISKLLQPTQIAVLETIACMALRLARLCGNSPEFWLNAQLAVDLWEAEQSIGGQIERIRPLQMA